MIELGTRDRDYLGRILEYALLTLRKLSAPANEDDLKKSHEKLLKELASIAQSDCEKESNFTISMIKGLRFVLDQIQVIPLYLIYGFDLLKVCVWIMYDKYFCMIDIFMRTDIIIYTLIPNGKLCE